MMCRRRPLLLALFGIALSACSAASPPDGVRGSSPPSVPVTAAAATCLPIIDAPPARTDGSIPALAAVQVVGPDEAWAVGRSLIVHTADAGRTWTKQYGGPEDLTAVDFVDAHHGWAVGPKALLATADGGRCWTTPAVPSPALHAVHFVDPDIGWGVTDDQGGMLVRTTDGGRTWNAQAAPARVQSVCFTDARRGWLVAAGALSGTEDGGGRWTQVALEHRGDEPWPTAEVQCTPGVAWVVATDGAALGHVAHALYRVPTGGPAQAVMADEYTHPVDAPTSQSTYPGPLSAVGPSTAVVAGFTPAFLPGQSAFLTVRTAAGRTIRPRGSPIPEVQRANGASFASADAGWVVGDVPGPGNAPRQGPGLIVRTIDGGRTWAVQYRTT